MYHCVCVTTYSCLYRFHLEYHHRLYEYILSISIPYCLYRFHLEYHLRLCNYILSISIPSRVSSPSLQLHILVSVHSISNSNTSARPGQTQIIGNTAPVPYPANEQTPSGLQITHMARAPVLVLDIPPHLVPHLAVLNKINLSHHVPVNLHHLPPK